MIYWIDGKPRHGKGLYALTIIEKRAKAENRQVYYRNIPGLKFDWIELENVEDWLTMPHGAIFVCDECHNDFPQDKTGARLPKYVSELAEHAHYGYDMFFITQSPKRVSMFLRDRVEEHHHVRRNFGKEEATIYKFYDMQQLPLSYRAKQDAIKSKFPYPKQLYGMYESSKFHNVKKEVPLRAYAIYPIVLTAFGLFAYAFMGMSSVSQKPVEEAKREPNRTEEPRQIPAEIYQKKHDVDGMGYLEARTPELEGLDFTAPIYREVIKPITAPYPAACVESKNKGCKCWTQQATLMNVPEEVCKQVVKNGFFVDWQQNNQQQQIQQQTTPQQQAHYDDSNDYPRDWSNVNDASLTPSPSNY